MKSRTDVVAEVTAQIIASLEAGVAPWARPWDGDGGFPIGLPRNASSGRQYSGINTLMLAHAGFSDPRWATYNQVKGLGGQVKRGEKGSRVVVWKFYDKVDPDNPEKTTSRGFARTFAVFNVTQCEGLDLPPLEAADPGTAADDLIARHNVKVCRAGDRALYHPMTDEIRIPPMSAFSSQEAYTATLFHELAHWTGASKRLTRTFGARFGDEAYAMEELVAELSAAFLCAHYGMQAQLQHSEYLGHWVKVLKNDKHAIFTASREAQKVLNFLTGGGSDDE